ncbi:tripartite tricarboxylate transporter TctB family protein [Ahrensia sp. 13_GOM-1096m]|uniref:tripartite tricarboxylate transporter TctB family protein n=1 Tax=Ahrensia sp. 13_GOM-1096m TaxID=1380380 RepID=UPI00047D5E58|nr:tripartite tricarboxylate transporter TctB family protein [Ahrensia sp. 13_GOM-1096m]
MFFTKDRIGGILLLIFCCFYALKIGNIRLLPFQADQAFTARTMPEALAIVGIILSMALIIFPTNRERFSIREFNWPLGLAFLVLMSLYGFTVRPFGFLLATSAFLIAGFAMLGERSPVKLVLVAVPLVVLFWALMNYGLDVTVQPLPSFLRD